MVVLYRPNVIAVRITVENGQFIVASICSSPTEPLPLSTMTNLLKKSKNIVLTGEFNAKHSDWNCAQVNSKGRILVDWLNKHNLKVLNNGTRTSLHSNTIVDLVISSEIPETTESQTLPYMGSDHLPIFTKFLRLNLLIDMHIVPCTFWKLYSSILTILFDQLRAEKENSMNDSINTYNWFLSFERFLAALKLRSDLKFSVQDIKDAIRSLRSKKSSGFDQVSNTMIRLLPEHYHALLTQAYNDLFRNAQWGSEWKTARNICLNKSENPAPITDQLRPISMLPTFSKIYEKLFLTKFNSWATRMNILPAQQSGARSHQATTSRVNCLLEQITQSLRYDSFTPVVYIDLLQAFDKLW
ncbi:unnamed protein product [Rotaria magnacalcarata]|uniref:Endonuclease/exonuclease/phosphatase domain-containing protein n=1 Tax=Rotaria magnacalcarata TaxID=392030 RepID=A0A815SIC5_9BILA|nr:unnamed protein product [Rotaria magnacalcarata]CAF4242987.1 unnamed protein product [Rotaria magnacalcarata]